mgnify:CR=1 FL=1
MEKTLKKPQKKQQKELLILFSAVTTKLIKSDFIQHVIKHKSEKDFINELENYLQQENNFFEQFDWWFFSKIDETLDEVNIPYYNPKTNRIDKFKPDFIFWLKKDNEYTILFVDPKSTEFADAYRKIDGYSRIFVTVDNDMRRSTTFRHNGFNIKIKLLLYTSDIASIPDEYQSYWFDKLSKVEDKLMKFLDFDVFS